MKTFSGLVGLLGLLLCLTALPARAAASFTGIALGSTVNGQVATNGYYEFLPASYNSASPQQNYAVLLFFHGLGEDGTGALTGTNNISSILQYGPEELINNPSEPLHSIFDTNNVIVLCPQKTGTPNVDWWQMADVRKFLNFALKAYPKIDPRRIWMSGLSSGCQGVQFFLDGDPNANQVAASVICAYRGGITNVGAPSIAKTIPFWAISSLGDWSSKPDDTVNLLAKTIYGGTVPAVMSSYPGGSNPSQNYSASFAATPTPQWTWVTGIDGLSEVSPKLSVLTGGDHNSWDRTYKNASTWTWLFQQQKPAVAITSPAASAVSALGSSITLTGTATDKDGNPLTGSHLVWKSSLDGTLGTGTSITTSSLSMGSHTITLQAIDNGFRGNTATVAVTVPYTGAFTAQFDFGDPTMTTPSTTNAYWNNITAPTNGSVPNAVNTTGTPVGVNVSITSPFTNTNNGGVVSSALYPATAQEDSIYVGGGGSYPSTGQVTVSGLNPAETYNFTFFGSRGGISDSRITTFTINGVVASLEAKLNTNQTVSLNNVSPNASGQVVITVGAAVGNTSTFGYLGVLIINTTGATASPLPSFRTAAGLPSDGSQDTLTPGKDGVPNIMKYAFNMTSNNYADIGTFNHQMMTAGGASGLPLVQPDGSNHLTATFVRRKSATTPGITYTPQVSNDLGASWSALGVTPTITSIDGTWERVVYTDTETYSTVSKRFLRVHVTSP